MLNWFGKVVPRHFGARAGLNRHFLFLNFSPHHATQPAAPLRAKSRSAVRVMVMYCGTVLPGRPVMSGRRPFTRWMPPSSGRREILKLELKSLNQRDCQRGRPSSRPWRRRSLRPEIRQPGPLPKLRVSPSRRRPPPGPGAGPGGGAGGSPLKSFSLRSPGGSSVPGGH